MNRAEPLLSRSESEPIVSRITTPCYVSRLRRVVKAGSVLPSIEHTLNTRRQTLMKLNPNLKDLDLNPWESQGKVPWAKLRIEPRLSIDASESLAPLSPLEAHALAHRQKMRSLKSVPLQHLHQLGWRSAPHIRNASQRLLWEDHIEQVLASTPDPSNSSYARLLTHLAQKQVRVGVGALKFALELFEGSLENAFVRMQRLGCRDGLSYHHFEGALTFLGLRCLLLTNSDTYTVFRRLSSKTYVSQQEFVARLQDPREAAPHDTDMMRDHIDVMVRYAALRARRMSRRGADGLPDEPTDKEWIAEESRLQELFHAMKKDQSEVWQKDFISFWGPTMVENATHWFALTLTQARDGCLSSFSFADTTGSTNWNQGNGNGSAPQMDNTMLSYAGRFTANRHSDDTWKATWNVSHVPTSASSMYGKKESRRLYTTEELMFKSSSRKVSFEAFKEIVPQICFDICGLHFGLSELDQSE